MTSPSIAYLSMSGKEGRDEQGEEGSLAKAQDEIEKAQGEKGCQAAEGEVGDSPCLGQMLTGMGEGSR